MHTMPSREKRRTLETSGRQRSGRSHRDGPRRGASGVGGVFLAVSVRSVTIAAFLAAVSCFGRGAEAISVGGIHSCSVFDDGTIKCWGGNDAGQLGLGDNTTRGASPTDMGDNLPEVDLGTGFFAVGVSCGLDHTCAWTYGGRVKCWGGNGYGQLGLEDVSNRGAAALTMGDDLPFVDLGAGESALTVVAANHFTCALLADETVKCFGRSDWGQLGSGNGLNNLGDAVDEMGDELPRVPLVPDGANYTVSVLTAHNGPCVIMQSDVASSVAVKCWGPNGYGSLGVGDSYNRGDDEGEMGGYLPAADLGTGVEPADIVSGMDFACVLTTAGGVKCWGRNANGQVGLGDIETYGDDPDEMGDNLPFVELGTGRTATSITAGTAHTCASLDDSSVKCWGKGYYGQTGLEVWQSMGQTSGQMGDSLPAVDLGTSSAAASSTRRKLGARDGGGLRGLQAAATTAVSVDTLSGGGQRSCAIVDAGSVKCWGRAWAGGLGLGDTADRGGVAGTMGDSLPTLSLGTGKVAVSPAPAVSETIAPTPGPSVAPTPIPSIPPTDAPPTPAPSPTPPPTAEPSIPPSPAPTVPIATARSGFEGLADDVGVSFTQGVAIAIGLPLAAIVLCCFCGFVIARKSKDKDQAEETGEVVAAANGNGGDAGRSKSAIIDGRAATVAPASAVGSRAGSRSGSRIGSRIHSTRKSTTYGPDGTISPIDDAEASMFFCEGTQNKGAQNGDRSAAVAPDGQDAEVWFAASRGAAAREGNAGDMASTNLTNLLGSVGSYGIAAGGNGRSSKNVTPKNLKHGLSSSETPPATWGGAEMQPIDASGSFTPESRLGGGSAMGESGLHSRNGSASHSRSASASRPHSRNASASPSRNPSGSRPPHGSNGVAGPDSAF